MEVSGVRVVLENNRLHSSLQLSNDKNQSLLISVSLSWTSRALRPLKNGPICSPPTAPTEPTAAAAPTAPTQPAAAAAPTAPTGLLFH